MRADCVECACRFLLLRCHNVENGKEASEVTEGNPAGCAGGGKQSSGAIWGGSRVAMATPDQAVATPELFGPMRRGGQKFIDILDFVYP